MESKFYVIEDEKDISEIITGDSHKLVSKYSYSEIWNSHVRGQKIGHLKDTGNNIKIEVDGIKIKLDYSQFCYLYNMMHIKHMLDPHMSPDTQYLQASEEYDSSKTNIIVVELSK